MKQLWSDVLWGGICTADTRRPGPTYYSASQPLHEFVSESRLCVNTCVSEVARDPHALLGTAWFFLSGS